MRNLEGKKILIGVSGSIAAYKVAYLVRLLVKSKAQVRVIMTKAAGDFITPLTLATLSKNPVLTDFVNEEDGTWNNHVDLGLWADLFVIAPATAHTLSKCANGSSDDLLVATYLSARCPVFFAPAMDLDMYSHGSTVRNMAQLENYGNMMIRAGFGELASGLIGDGRMAEPEDIVQVLTKHFSFVNAAFGKRVLITAGPTVEPIDPVRFISNRSSGKMGYAIARVFSDAGADVTVVSGPVDLNVRKDGLTVIAVESAQEMFEAANAHFDRMDVIIYAAAVADYTPEHVAPQKIKKQGDSMTLGLTKTIDIAGALSLRKKPHQLAIGFALETENGQDHALRKLESKKLDYILLNSLNDAGAGFAHDTNKVTVIDKNKKITEFPLKTKTEVALDLFQIVLTNWNTI
jgi:phosphopantothenoylcysteine decarboxylase / phosphopantothenate---cysteine ligase